MNIQPEPREADSDFFWLVLAIVMFVCGVYMGWQAHELHAYEQQTDEVRVLLGLGL